MEKDNKTEKNLARKEVSGKEYIFAVGRRKTAVARVRLYKKDKIVWNDTEIKKAEIFVNKQPAVSYFGKEAERVYRQPLIVTNAERRFAVTAMVSGGGKRVQLDALVLGVSRALDKFDKEKYRPILKKRGFLTRDPRVRERRKVGMGGKARRKKQSPKR